MKPPFVKLYTGYGHQQQLVVMGHVLSGSMVPRDYDRAGWWSNLLHLLKLFSQKPLPHHRLRLHWNNQSVEGHSEKDGFFRLEWRSLQSVPAGTHQVQVDCLDAAGNVVAGATGEILVPHITQLGIISDIDDTVLVSHSATIIRRLRQLFTRNPRTRRSFAMVAKHYQLLANAQTENNKPNPFFYVSSSEWNLYDDLVEFFRFNELPKGVFLLNQLKRWYQLPFSGKTKHGGKLTRILRILEAFPKQHFILLGDNSQKDPIIYRTLAEKYPDRIRAVYLRMIRPTKTSDTEAHAVAIRQLQVSVCLFTHSEEAIEHGRLNGLLTGPALVNQL